MIDLPKTPLAAALAFCLLAGGCTFNTIRRFEQPAAPKPEPPPAAPSCSIFWSGTAPAGWTVDALRRFVTELPASGCPAVTLTFQRNGSPIDWQTGLAEPPSDWIVRSALTQYSEAGDTALRRIYASASNSTCASPAAAGKRREGRQG